MFCLLTQSQCRNTEVQTTVKQSKHVYSSLPVSSPVATCGEQTAVQVAICFQHEAAPQTGEILGRRNQGGDACGSPPPDNRRKYFGAAARNSNHSCGHRTARLFHWRQRRVGVLTEVLRRVSGWLMRPVMDLWATAAALH